MVHTKRVYEEPGPDDGLRVLVDRIWPRGLSREKARVDRWMKEVAPSTELRKWFNHDPARWNEFRKRYFRELAEQRELIEELGALVVEQKVTLVYAAKDECHNNAVGLAEYLARRESGRPRA